MYQEIDDIAGAVHGRGNDLIAVRGNELRKVNG